MERVYVDMSQMDGACVGVLYQEKRSSRWGTTVYSMLVEDRDEGISEICR